MAKQIKPIPKKELSDLSNPTDIWANLEKAPSRGELTMGIAVLVSDYNNAKKKLDNEMHDTILKFLKTPLLAAISTWGQSMMSIDFKIPSALSKLISENFMLVYDNASNTLCRPYLPIAKLSAVDHIKIINEIRSRRDLSHQSKEHLVGTYVSFINWLSEQTYHHIKSIADPDLMKRQSRAIDFSLFIKLMDHLDEKAQLVAKLLYYGGSRILEDVLDLQIEDINFRELKVRFGSQIIMYPAHIFADIKAIAQDRKSGQLFLGRQEAPLNPATIYRKFKEAGSQIGLGDTFSPKSLTTNR